MLQATERNSTVYIKPRVVVPDPFRGGDHVLVLCDTFSGPTVETGFAEMKPHPSNSRAPCEHVMRLASASEPVFTVEQQYTLLDPATSWPLGELPCQAHGDLMHSKLDVRVPARSILVICC